MEIKKGIKESFAIIGKEGSTKDGPDFIRRLWNEANTHFGEVAHLAKKGQSGNFLGFWGAMSDFSREFKPWEENFSQGLYLAGVEVVTDAMAPQGWVKWVIPGYEYVYVEAEYGFPEVLRYLAENNLPLVGAVQEYYCPEENGRMYLFFPIRKL